MGFFDKISGKQNKPSSGIGETYITRMGQFVKADSVFRAWTSENLPQMLNVLNVKTNPIDRHFLLSGIVRLTYKQRTIPQMRQLCIETAEKHVAEFPQIAPSLKIEMGGILPEVPTFQYLVTLLVEDKKYERALEICKVAVQIGLSSGTQGGYQGMVETIQKKMQSQP